MILTLASLLGRQFRDQDTASGGTQVTSVQPPEYQLPFLRQGMEGAADLYGAGGPEQYTGNRVVGFAPETEAALEGTVARATGGSPLVGAAQNYVASGLNTPVSSQFGTASNPYADVTNPFGGDSNPYLDAAFDRAANRTQNRLTSEFARAGRDVDASAPARAGMLSDLAAQIYAPAYESERDRMANFESQRTGIGAQGYENERGRLLSDLTAQRGNQASLLGYANPLAEADYRDLAALRGVGAEQEDLSGRMIEDAASRFEYEQDRPEAALDRYLQRIQGQNLGQTSSTQLPDVYRNTAGSAVGGAMAGGQMFGPWGALGGLLLGGLL